MACAAGLPSHDHCLQQGNFRHPAPHDGASYNLATAVLVGGAHGNAERQQALRDRAERDRCARGIPITGLEGFPGLQAAIDQQVAEFARYQELRSKPAPVQLGGRV